MPEYMVAYYENESSVTSVLTFVLTLPSVRSYSMLKSRRVPTSLN